ncbi:hypothetical protein SteCoe_33586 [Stentor coeruleus]|uniref:Short-chain dehydrogenase/reductase 3 n=1 Tax=Stentor coeruleus TaxID=5963 RepID=A0A1R2AWD6_9CILI|nr:hypothetical protein SteCoe_33586 [Stentor coeruleus]
MSQKHRKTSCLVSAYIFYKYFRRNSGFKKHLKDKIVFITGAASGIGKQVAILMAEEGAKVVIADIDMKKAEDLVKEILGKNFKAMAVYCDVMKVESVRKAAEVVRKMFGDPDILVNNAGIVSGKGITELTVENVERTFRVNVISHFYTIKEFLPSMLARNQGHIVTIASLAGLAGTSKQTDYSASKHAAIGLDESLRNELKSINSNVKTTCINPYYIDTGMFKGIKSLIPLLKEAYVSQRIVDAIKKEEKVVVLPKILNIVYLVRALFNVENFDRIMNLVGVNRSMETFTGRL